MSRNFDYLRGELLQVQKNQEQLMENFGIPLKRASVFCKNNRISKFHEDLKRTPFEAIDQGEETKRRKTPRGALITINCLNKSNENSDKNNECKDKNCFRSPYFNFL